MNAIQNFAFEEHLVRVIERAGEPWFVANDICRALELSNPRKAVADLDEDEKDVTISDTLGGSQQVNIISEPGVYRLVFRSRKPEAERFKRWLAHEVIPQIRKTGSYNGGGAQAALPDLDNTSIAVWRTKLDLVREARIQFGAARAKLLWHELGLPEVPQLPADEEPQRCLAHLLGWAVEGVTMGEFIHAAVKGDQEVAEALAQKGIRLCDGGFVVANSHPFIRRLYRATRWKDHYRFLRRIAGAQEAKVMKYGRNITSRGVELPEWLVDEL